MISKYYCFGKQNYFLFPPLIFLALNLKKKKSLNVNPKVLFNIKQTPLNP